MRPTFHPILLATFVTGPWLRTLDAQTRAPQPPVPPRGGEVRIERLPQGMSVIVGAGNRAVLGVTLAGDARADTLGVRIAEVRSDGPAAKAGLKAGDVITEVNGVRLRVSGTDASDPELAGIGQRRLQRTLAKAKAGDEVELRVLSGNSTRSVTVKTVAQSELDVERPRVAGMSSAFGDRDRPALGLSLALSHSVRDTLGLFVMSVVGNGPAESAGIVEGERIAAVNGVDVRVPREDVEDMRAAESRINRFMREVQKGDAGETVTLRVYAAGRYRDVSVKTVKASTLPSSGFRINVGDLRMPGAAGDFDFTVPQMELHVDGAAIDAGRESIRRTMEELRRSMQEMGRDFQFRWRDGSENAVAPRVRVMPRRTVTIL